MDREEAAKTLSVPADASTDVIERSFGEILSRYRTMLSSPLASGVRRMYEESLRQLIEAGKTLLPDAPETDWRTEAANAKQVADLRRIQSEETVALENVDLTAAEPSDGDERKTDARRTEAAKDPAGRAAEQSESKETQVRQAPGPRGPEATIVRSAERSDRGTSVRLSPVIDSGKQTRFRAPKEINSTLVGRGGAEKKPGDAGYPRFSDKSHQVNWRSSAPVETGLPDSRLAKEAEDSGEAWKTIVIVSILGLAAVALLVSIIALFVSLVGGGVRTPAPSEKPRGADAQYGYLVLKSDHECQISIDNEGARLLRAGDTLTLKVKAGEHVVDALSHEDSSGWTHKLTVDADSERELLIDFKEMGDLFASGQGGHGSSQFIIGGQAEEVEAVAGEVTAEIPRAEETVDSRGRRILTPTQEGEEESPDEGEGSRDQNAPATDTPDSLRDTADAGDSGQGRGTGSDADAAGSLGPIELGPGITPPVFEPGAIPPYPRRAKLMRANGVVVLRIVVRADGRAEVLEVIKETPQGLGFASHAIEVLRRGNWIPAMKEGKSIAVYQQLRIPYQFR